MVFADPTWVVILIYIFKICLHLLGEKKKNVTFIFLNKIKIMRNKQQLFKNRLGD